jgi:hypothetical protein
MTDKPDLIRRAKPGPPWGCEMMDREIAMRYQMALEILIVSASSVTSLSSGYVRQLCEEALKSKLEPMSDIGPKVNQYGIVPTPRKGEY